MRIRSIKPEFWVSLTVNRLSIPARLTFIGLWNYADDEGRGINDPRLIRAALWPLDSVATEKIAEWMDEIHAAGLIDCYEDSERPVFQVVHWSEHQRVDKPRPSVIAPYPGGDVSPTPPGTLPEASGSRARARIGLEGNGREGKGSLVPAEPERFAEFWKAYPRKDDKRKAREAFKRALKRAPAEAIIAGAERYRGDPNRESEFTKLPTTWLNADAWENGLLPMRQSQADPISSWLASKEADHG